MMNAIKVENLRIEDVYEKRFTRAIWLTDGETSGDDEERLVAVGSVDRTDDGVVMDFKIHIKYACESIEDAKTIAMFLLEAL